MMQRRRSDRLDRDARARRARAQAHLDRVRQRRAGAAHGVLFRLVPRASRLPLAGALLAGAAAGALWGDALLDALGISAQRVEVIAVRGVQRLSAADVAGASGVQPGAALRDVDLRGVARQLATHDWIETAEAVRAPGGALVVEIVERIALAAIDLGAPPETYAVDASGAPFTVADAETLAGLPRLAAAASVEARQPSARLAEAVRLAYRLPGMGIALPEEISIAADDDPEGFALRLPSLPPRFVLGREALDERIEQLAHVLARRADAVTSATTVDLRFADQVVLRNEPTPRGSAAALGGRSAPHQRKPAG